VATFAIGECTAIRPETPVPAIVVTLDSTFTYIGAEGEWHSEVRVGNVEAQPGGRKVFGAVAKADIHLQALIRRNLDTVEPTKDTALTTLTDRCSRLASVFPNHPRFRRSRCAERNGPRQLMTDQGHTH
jgi:hypothetical protein